MQTPVELGFDVLIKDFNKSAKSQIKAMPKSEHGNFCILCMARIKALKLQKMVKSSSKNAMPDAPRKIQSKKFPNKILNELRRLVAFHCQVFIFLECKKTNHEATYALMGERFYGDLEKQIKGACDQLVDGDNYNCFAFLYNVGEGESGPERTLKSFCCCGSDTSSMFVAGVHFTAKMIGTKSNKKLSGQTLWTAGQTVHRSIKKAMAIVPKLDGKVVNLAKNNKVVGYASGKNLESFIQFIDNGMYTLSLNKGRAANEDKEDNDDVVEEVVNDSASKRIDSWDPFNSVVTPEGYCFFGNVSFLYLGPASS